MSETNKSSSFERRVQSYLKPVNHNFITQFVKNNEISESKAINEAVNALREKTNEKKK